MSSSKMERAGRRVKAGSLSGLSGGSGGGGGVRRQRSLEWSGDRYSSSDDERPPQPPPLADRVFASLLAQATQQFDDEQRRIYGKEATEEKPRYSESPLRQSAPFPLESMNRRFYRRNRNSKGEEIYSGDGRNGAVTSGGGTLSRRARQGEEMQHENVARINRHCLNGNERDCDSPPEPAPPEVPPRGPSLHVALRHRVPEPPTEADRLYLSEEYALSEGNSNGNYAARSPMSSSTTGHSSSSHHSSGKHSGKRPYSGEANDPP